MADGFALFGRDLFGEPITPLNQGPLARRFEWPAFSVLSARDGEWQARKQAWLSLGIKSEVGRGATLLSEHQNTGAQAANLAERYGLNVKQLGLGSGVYGAATSVFDPVLCELAYRWFCPPGGQVVDPFAGGSVRGIVAALLGLRYHGIELPPRAGGGQPRAGRHDPASVRGARGGRVDRG